MKPEIHIGKHIEERIVELGIQKQFVAEEMAMSRQNLVNVFKSESIQTHQLEKFSKLLKKNFFLLYRGIADSIDEHGDTHNITIQIDKAGHVKDSNTEKKLDAIYRLVGQIEEEMHVLIAEQAGKYVQNKSKSKEDK